MNLLRPTVLAVSRTPGLRSELSANPMARRMVRRFVAGEHRDAALATAATLLHSGRTVTVDLLGEDTADRAHAEATLAEYCALVDDLATVRRREGDVEVSVKLSALGQALPGDGARIATDNLATLCAAARAAGVLVTVDAERHTGTDSTLAAVAELRSEFPRLGVVLQAYLRRTESDCKEFAGADSRVRLCKGAYAEPKSVAYQSRSHVDQSYLRCLEVLFSGSGYPMVASHDPAMIAAAATLADRYRDGSAEGYEHQMLFGVRDGEQRTLAALGRQVRVYLPYGTEWYGYFARRIAERPANLAFFFRALVERR